MHGISLFMRAFIEIIHRTNFLWSWTLNNNHSANVARTACKGENLSSPLSQTCSRYRTEGTGI